MSLSVSTGSLEVDQVGAVTVVNFTCNAMLDEQTVQETDCLRELGDGPGNPILLLNFSAVRSFGNLMLAELLRMQEKIKALGGKMALCGLTSDLYEVFQITGLDRHFSILQDDPEAQEVFLAGQRQKHARKPRGSRPRPSLPKRPLNLTRNSAQPQFAR